MAQIIRLKNDPLTSQEDAEENAIDNQYSAEIILFPGVRYERWEEAQSQANDQERSQVRNSQQGQDRDWLKM